MKRLYLRIYLMVLASLLLFGLLSIVGWKIFADDDEPWRRDAIISGLAGDLLPADAPPEVTQATLDRWRERLTLDLALYDREGRPIALAGPGLVDVPRESIERAGDDRHRRRASSAHTFALPLPDGRLIAARWPDARDDWRSAVRGVVGVAGFLGLVGLAVGLAAWWPARRMTRRLESLQATVDAFGAGDLQARSRVRGRDEIARLASHFNQTAQRMADLVQAQRSLLANASHELRSPLARIRMAVELSGQSSLTDEERGRAHDELLLNVAELDELVDEVLMASRLDAMASGAASGPAFTDIDLAGLVAEECARLDVQADLAPLTIRGDTRLLRRLIRNLIENARRHGGGLDQAHVSLRRDDASGRIVVSVCDRGPGVAPEERERIFEPFYRVRGASEKAGGVGLGLALVRQIAHHHQGEVRCVDRSGGGSCFEVSLPG